MESYRNYFLRFRFRLRFRLLTSYDSGSKKYFGNFLPFYILSFFTRKKLISFIRFVVKCELKKMLNEGNQMNSFILCVCDIFLISFCYGSYFLKSYCSGLCSTRQKVTVPTVPVPVPQRGQWSPSQRQTHYETGDPARLPA